MYNQGDAMELLLDIKVGDTPLEEYAPDEIEFSIGNNRYLLTNGDIYIDSDTGKYALFVDQEVTFEMCSIAKYQIRVRKGAEVVSDSVQRLSIGKSLSKAII